MALHRIPAAIGFLSSAALLALAAPGANAQSVCGPTVYATISSSGFSCTIGDKRYSDFSFTGTGDWTNSSFSFVTSPVSPGVQQYTFNGSGAFTPGNTYAYSYKMTITGPAGPTQFEFDAFRTGFTSSSLTGTNLGTNTLTALGLGGPYGPSTSSSANGGGQGNAVDIASGPGYLGNDRGPMTFSGNINVTQGVMNVFTDSVVQQQAVPTTATNTPGPLPILGAAAAFGSVRKLRRFSFLLKA